MERRSLLGALGGLALCPLCAPRARAAGWSWSGATGPEHWGSLPGLSTCADGSQQSPIDLAGGIKADLPPLEVSWRQANATIVNPGYTIRVNMPSGSTLRVGSTAYEMVEFHFHAPAEHAVGGKRAAMEVHFVHRRTGGADPVHGSNDWQEAPQGGGFGVIGVFLQPGGVNAAFAEIVRAMPPAPGGEAPITVAPAGLLPRARAYWSYAGSLTTPACAEIVTWMVLREPIAVGQADIDRFRALYPHSARPLQPRNRRFVLMSG